MDLVKRHGGKVVSALSKKTNYLVVGRDPGESKLQKVCDVHLDYFFSIIFIVILYSIPL